jgi:hypothetical protein
MTGLRFWLASIATIAAITQLTSTAAATDTGSHTAGYVTAKELPDGAVPAVDADGNFIIGPTHNAAPEIRPRSVLQGTVVTRSR